MPKDIIDFSPARQDPDESPEIIRAEIAEALPYNNPYLRQSQTRRDGSFRWIALAVVVGAVVAMAFVNFFAR